MTPRFVCEFRLFDMKDLIAYNPDTGVLTWKVDRGSVKAGEVVSSKHKKGYLQVRVDGRLYLAHRVAVFLHTGKWPEKLVDHRNGVKDDNRWSNLREASQTVNMQNLRKAPGSKKLPLGVRSRGDKFTSQIRVDGETVHLGTFDTEHEASSAYLTAKRNYHEGCTI